MLLMQEPKAFDDAVETAVERIRLAPDCSMNQPEAWD